MKNANETMGSVGSSLSNGALNDYKNKVLSAEDQVADMSQKAGERVGTMVSGFATKATDYVKTSRDYVKENPAKGIAIAAGIGLLAGSLLTVSMRRRRQ